MINTYNYNNSIQLSEHFSAAEFRCKCGKVHDFLVDEKLISKLEKLFSTLSCSKIIVTSGYRCSAHDKNVGGNGSGQHTKGTAADVCCYGQNGQPISSKLVCCKAQDTGFNGIGKIDETAVHVDVRTSGKWYGDETVPGGTSGSVTSDFYSYFGISEYSWSGVFSAEIKELQEIMNDKGANLAVDGIAGDKTLSECRKYTINSGDSGELTRWVQKRLNSMGFSCGTADGTAGARTLAGIAAFQKANGLCVGYLGGEDWFYLIK